MSCRLGFLMLMSLYGVLIGLSLLLLGIFIYEGGHINKTIFIVWIVISLIIMMLFIAITVLIDNSIDKVFIEPNAGV